MVIATTNPAIGETVRENEPLALLVSSSPIGAIIDDDGVRAVTLTGSEPAGRAGPSVKTSVLP